MANGWKTSKTVATRTLVRTTVSLPVATYIALTQLAVLLLTPAVVLFFSFSVTFFRADSMASEATMIIGNTPDVSMTTRQAFFPHDGEENKSPRNDEEHDDAAGDRMADADRADYAENEATNEHADVAGSEHLGESADADEIAAVDRVDDSGLSESPANELEPEDEFETAKKPQARTSAVIKGRESADEHRSADTLKSLSRLSIDAETQTAEEAEELQRASEAAH